MGDENHSPVILRLEGLRQELTDKEKDEHFNVYVDELLEFRSRDFIGLLGPSGCGKTTLLTVLGLLRSPTHVEQLKTFELFLPDSDNSGDWDRVDLRDAWQNRRRTIIEDLRREHFGFALQSGELVSSLTVRENIAMPLKFNQWKKSAIDSRIAELMEQFQLKRIQDDIAKGMNTNDDQAKADGKSNNGNPNRRWDRNAVANSRINRLSGGEYQRVVLARAIAHRPAVVFVDEPTSALNRELARGALTAMHDLQYSRTHSGITLMITHDETLAAEFCNVIVRMAPRKNEPAGEVVEVARIKTVAGS